MIAGCTVLVILILSLLLWFCIRKNFSRYGEDDEEKADDLFESMIKKEELKSEFSKCKSTAERKRIAIRVRRQKIKDLEEGKSAGFGNSSDGSPESKAE